MSQDNVKCAKCGESCGYDDSKGCWEGHNLAICGQCKGNLISRAVAFFGMQGTSSDEYGLTIEWKDLDKILSRIQRDCAMRISYLVTDKELYQRTKTRPISILES